jgi:cell wall-associated NlpC family hydrolase
MSLRRTSVYRKSHHIWGGLAILFLLISCSREVVTWAPEPTLATTSLSSVGFSIQVGAFANADNAVRLTETLQRKDLDAYHFVHKSGLYKVRFGNYPTRKTARKQADLLKKNGVISQYYIVRPQRRYSQNRVRHKIVQTAKSFIGVPYKWGGASPQEGFDCSGLTMVVYRLNGLNLPRNSRQQWRMGVPIKRSRLMKGDLVFFSTTGKKRISHVGIYAGGGTFIHAPGRGKQIRTAKITNRYYKKNYRGARRYL